MRLITDIVIRYFIILKKLIFFFYQWVSYLRQFSLLRVINGSCNNERSNNSSIGDCVWPWDSYQGLAPNQPKNITYSVCSVSTISNHSDKMKIRVSRHSTCILYFSFRFLHSRNPLLHLKNSVFRYDTNV